MGDELFRLPRWAVLFSTRALLEDRNGDFGLGPTAGLKSSAGGKGLFHDSVTGAFSEEESCGPSMKTATEGCGSAPENDGLFRWKQNQLTHYTTEQGLASNASIRLVEDRQGKLLDERAQRHSRWLNRQNSIKQQRNPGAASFSHALWNIK